MMYSLGVCINETCDGYVYIQEEKEFLLESSCVKSGKLKKCDTWFDIFGGNKFEIHDRRGNCFEELVEFRECRRARNSNSNLRRFA